MAFVTRVKNTRLGVHFSGRRIGHLADNNATLGWTLIKTPVNKPHRIDRGNTIDLLRAAAANWNVDEDGPFTLFTYDTDEAYKGSQGYLSGLGRLEHRMRVEQTAAQLASEGINVTIMEVS